MRRNLLYAGLLAIGSFLFHPALAQNSQDEGELLMTIGCMTDLHSEYEMINTSNVNSVMLRPSIVTTLEKMKEQEDIDLMILGGDYTSQVTVPTQAHWERARELLIQKTRSVFKGDKATPVIYITGNHEFDAAGYQTKPKPYNSGEYYLDLMDTDIGELSENDSFYEMGDNGSKGEMPLLAAYHYQINGFDFVMLNCAKHLFDSNENYYYSEESVQWCLDKIESLYAENPDRLVFFVMHIPFGDSNSISATNKGQASTEPGTKLLKSELPKFKNLIVLYGHDHGGNKAFIRQKTSQRVTRYNTGGAVIDSFDEDHVDGTTRGEAAEQPSGNENKNPGGTYYLKNYGNGKYLGAEGAEIAIVDAGAKQPVTLERTDDVDYLFRTSLTSDGTQYNLSCGGSGRFSLKTRMTTVNTQENGYWFLVEDINATPVTGKKASVLEAGKYYFIVQNYQGDFALGNTVYNPTSAPRVESVAVTISNNTVTMATPEAAKNYLYTLEPVEGEGGGSGGDTPSPEPTPEGMTKGTFYLQSLNNGKFLGADGSDIAVLDKDSKMTVNVELTDADKKLFRTSLTSGGTQYNLSCGGEGLYSLKTRMSTVNEQENGYWFRIESQKGNQIVAKKVSTLEYDMKYIIVQNYQGYYALGNETKLTSSNAVRMNSTMVTIEEDAVVFADVEDVRDYIYVLRDTVAPGPYAGGECFLKNVSNGMYLGAFKTDIAFTDFGGKIKVNIEKSDAFKKLFKVSMFSDDVRYNTSCGGEGLFSLKTRISSTNEQENAYFFCVEDTTTEGAITATKASALEYGKLYVLVQKYSGAYYAMGNEIILTADGYTRLKSVGVGNAIVDNAISFAGIDEARGCLFTLEPPTNELEPAPVYEPSFVSTFLGSMRFYNNDIVGSWIPENYTKDPRVIQAMMIYIYSNRIEFHMKNYGESTTISEVEIAENLTPYTVFRKVTQLDTPTLIKVSNAEREVGHRIIYNMYGIPVDENYHGIVIENGKKIYR